MNLWSRGLGRKVVKVDVSKLESHSVDEALEDLPETVQKNITKAISEKSIALTGGKIEPVKWDFIITIDWEDVKGLMKIISSDIPKKRSEGKI